MNHVSDWHPGRHSPEYHEGWDRIFGGKLDDKEQVDSALKFFKQDKCCGECNCSNVKLE